MRKTPILVTKPSAICFSLKKRAKAAQEGNVGGNVWRGVDKKEKVDHQKIFFPSLIFQKIEKKTEKTSFT